MMNSQYFPQFKKVPKDRLPTGYENGNTFTSVCINTTIYLPWLTSCCLKAGVVFKRAVLKHISEASQAHHSGESVDLVVNCTGLSARTLGGVEDSNMIPARGQTVLVRNEANAMYASSGCDDGDDEVCYMMQRAAGKPSPDAYVLMMLVDHLGRGRHPTRWLLPEG